MAEIIKNKTQKCTRNLPHDIIENILSRLPVKSLLRFKAVSKPWKATISDPKFAEIHRQQQSQENLLAWDVDTYDKLHIVKLENDKFQVLSVIEYPPEEDLDIGMLCCCDGLGLLWCKGSSTYLLWNPSTRKYKKFSCPYPIRHGNESTLYGLCYDPLSKDYKVVMADEKHYAVFYCRDNYWTEMKEMEKNFPRREYPWGFPLDRSIYQVLTTKADEGEDEFGFEIICFDGRDEKFKKLPKPDRKQDIDLFDLISLGGHLCLYLNSYSEMKNELSIMKKVGVEDSWMMSSLSRERFKALSCDNIIPSCLTNGNENEVILKIGDDPRYRRHYVLYNFSKNTFAKIQTSSTKMIPVVGDQRNYVLHDVSKNTSALIHVISTRGYVEPVPYLENLYSF